ncbi:trigger factor-like [Schistocerca nitens]|uniref:trigger factor-like n=1 Tax=Schistocerca nitens TaxID=7011 RepID=UPI002117FCA4|nr:trigger factor-like [Schistocerca nitens]
MKGGLVLLIAGVLLVAYCTPLAAADDGDEVAEELGENRDADDDDTDSIADEDDDDSGFNWGLIEERRRALKGAHARVGHAKHAGAGSRHAAGRAANRPHARSGAAHRAAHSK